MPGSQKTAEKCTKIYNARAQPLFSSLKLWFSDVAAAVAFVVFLRNSTIFRCKMSVKYSFKQITVIVKGCMGEGERKYFFQFKFSLQAK